jgi:protease II
MNMPDHLTCEKIEAVSRDGTPLPLVMVYDKRFYTDKSAWIMCSKGAMAEKEDLAFRPERLSLTDRGFVLAFPMIRGNSIQTVNLSI